MTLLVRTRHNSPWGLIPLGLAAVLVLAGCATAAPTAEASRPTETAVFSPSSTPELPTPTGGPTETAAATIQVPAATSRGPDLHATDPSTVRLASGGLQLVEFFRFT